MERQRRQLADRRQELNDQQARLAAEWEAATAELSRLQQLAAEQVELQAPSEDSALAVANYAHSEDIDTSPLIAMNRSILARCTEAKAQAGGKLPASCLDKVACAFVQHGEGARSNVEMGAIQR